MNPACQMVAFAGRLGHYASMLDWMFKRRKPARSRVAQDAGRFFFLHMPKTGGTSFRIMLYKLFRPEHIVPNVEDLRANGGNYYLMDQVAGIPPERLANCRLFVGHLPLVCTDLFDTAPRVLIFLREPVARAVSNLRQIQHMQHPDLTLRQMIDQPGLLTRLVTNRQTRLLSLRSLDEALARGNSLKPDRARLDCAKRNLADCAFIGLTERFDTSVALCERTFGWRFPTGPLMKNVTPEADDDIEDILPRIRAETELDQELYAYAQELFAARLTSV
jgi:hypothetical protein